ncbi:MAG: MBL fold metallo-hydrolase [Methanocellales archaeon]
MTLYILYSRQFDYDSNIYILKVGDRALLIDAGSGYNSERLRSTLDALGIARVEQILLTHNDHDHSGGVQFFPEAIVKVHQLDRDNRFSKAKVEILQDGDEIKFGEYILKVVHTPGHSPGSVCFYEKNRKWLFSGDTPMEFLPSVVDRHIERHIALEQLRQSVNKLSKLDISIVYPGHGKPLYPKS